jgi:UDP-glucose 4-epimerase
MRVLVVGATGNIGTSVMQVLADDPSVTELVGVARRLPAWLPDNARFIGADIRSADLVELCRGSAAVVHLAWAFQPTHRPVATWENNVLGGIRVFEAAAEAGVPSLVYASSVGAYSPGPGRQVDETWPTHSLPTAGYGREKAYLERYLDAFELRHPSMRVVRFRPSFVFKRQSASEQRRIFAGPLLPRMLARPGRLPVLPVPAGLRFQAVHADDVAEAFRLAVVGEVSGAFNLAADPIIDREQVATIFGARTVSLPGGIVRAGLGVAWRLRAVPAEDALLQLLLNLPTLHATRARQELGWTPRHSGVEAMQEMLHGLADGAGLATPPLAPARPSR